MYAGTDLKELNHANLDTDYFLWLFSRSSFYSTYFELNSRGSIIVNITKQIMYDMPVPIPNTLAEQKSISIFLKQKNREIDHLIDSKQQLLTELEAYKKSVIYEYVTGKREVPQ